MAGASHHFWTHPVLETDAPEIQQIREYIYSVVMDWIGVKVVGTNKVVSTTASTAAVNEKFASNIANPENNTSKTLLRRTIE